MVVADCENYFISGSKDRTVKIWSLRNHGDGSASLPARYTYSGHQKPVTSVELLPSMNNVASCDGTVHVSWKKGRVGGREGGKEGRTDKQVEGSGRFTFSPYWYSWQLWDLETGYCVQQFSPRNTQFLVMKSFPAPHPVIVVGTSDLQLRLVALCGVM